MPSELPRAPVWFSMCVGLVDGRLLTCNPVCHRVTQKLYNQFDAWAIDPNSNPLHPNLRKAVFCAAIRHDTLRAISVLKREWFTTKSVDGKRIIYSALGAVRVPYLVRTELLPFLAQSSPPAPAWKSVPPADMPIFANSMAANRHARRSLWEYIKTDFDGLCKKLGIPLMIEWFVEASISDFNDLSDVKDMEEFFATRDTRAFERTLKNAIDKTTMRAMYKQRDAAKLKEWLVENGYAKE